MAQPSSGVTLQVQPPFRGTQHSKQTPLLTVVPNEHKGFPALSGLNTQFSLSGSAGSSMLEVSLLLGPDDSYPIFPGLGKVSHHCLAPQASCGTTAPALVPWIPDLLPRPTTGSGSTSVMLSRRALSWASSHFKSYTQCRCGRVGAN